MELALTLGDPSKSFSPPAPAPAKDLGFCMADDDAVDRSGEADDHPPLQLDLLPFSPANKSSDTPSIKLLPFPWLTENVAVDRGRGSGTKRPAGMYSERAAAALSSPNCTVSSLFPMDLPVFRSGAMSRRDLDHGGGGSSNSKGSDEEFDNGIMMQCRKKLRLTKQQSAFLEESFKEHSTLNPRQKLALSKQLGLRPRQVEVWFQNRRARTKLKQTEVDCEYLKSCCEKLTEENVRLQKELQELRVLKASQPFYKQHPPTTLTMCPSCERVVAAATLQPRGDLPSNAKRSAS